MKFVVLLALPRSQYNLHKSSAMSSESLLNAASKVFGPRLLITIINMANNSDKAEGPFCGRTAKLAYSCGPRQCAVQSYVLLCHNLRDFHHLTCTRKFAVNGIGGGGGGRRLRRCENLCRCMAIEVRPIRLRFHED